MRISAKKRQELYDAIDGSVADARRAVMEKIKDLNEERQVDDVLYRLIDKIWKKVKSELNIQD